MAEVHLLPRRFSQEGAERLARALEQALTANADLGPRWPHIRALGLSLQQLSRDLGQEAERISAMLGTPTPEVEAFRTSFHQLSAAFSRLGFLAEAYSS